MQALPRQFIFVLIIVAVFAVLGFLFAPHIFAAWVDAPASPPNYGTTGCTSPCLQADFSPVTLNGTAQTKAGSFAVGAGSSITAPQFCIGASCVTSWASTGSLSGAGTANYLSKWTSGTALGSSLIADDGIGGHVGIGISTGFNALAGNKLEVAGAILGQAFFDQNNVSYYIDPASSGSGSLAGTFTIGGNTGIGTTITTGAKLAVNNPQTVGKTGSLGDAVYAYSNSATGAALSAEQGNASGYAGYFSGRVAIADGTQGLNKVLTSDASGVASWVAPTAGSNYWTLAGSDITNNNTGNVGIGTAAPTGKFQVGSNAYVWAGWNTNTPTPAPRCACDTTSTAVECPNKFKTTDAAGSVCYDWNSQYAYQYNATSKPDIYVNSVSGSVGIATSTTPAMGLAVDGGISATASNLYMFGQTGVTSYGGSGWSWSTSGGSQGGNGVYAVGGAASNGSSFGTDNGGAGVYAIGGQLPSSYPTLSFRPGVGVYGQGGASWDNTVAGASGVSGTGGQGLTGGAGVYGKGGYSYYNVAGAGINAQGGQGVLSGSTGGDGIYAVAGTGVAGNGWAGNFQGNVNVTGVIRGGSYGFGGGFSCNTWTTCGAAAGYDHVNMITGTYGCPAGFTAFLLYHGVSSYDANAYLCWK